jgi:hypothetical protein
MPRQSEHDSLTSAAREALQAQPPAPPVSRLAVPLVIAAVLVLCLATAWMAETARRQTAQLGTAGATQANRLLALTGTSATLSGYLLVQPGAAGRDDLFLCTAAVTVTCQNLTQSPGAAEVWPVLDPTAQHVAYYGLGQAGTDLYLLALPDGTAQPLTLHAGESGLHSSFEITPTTGASFSPNGEWLAFPAQALKHGAVELFVAKTDGQTVLRVSNLEQNLRDYIWLDDRTLVFIVQWPDRTLHRSQARLEGSSFVLEELP